MHIHIFFPCDFLTSIIWNRPISWWSSFRFEVEEPPSRKQSNGESRPSVAWHAGNLMVDFIFTPPDISGTQGWSQTPRSIAAGWSLLECWIAFSIFCILADRGWSDILKEGSRSPVVDYQHTSSLAARWTSHSIHRCAFFCATCTGHKCAGLRVKRCESARWLQKVGTQFFSFQDEWKVTTATRCAEVFLYPLNSVHFPVLFKQPHWHVCDAKQQHPPPWPLDFSFRQGGGACWKIRARSHSATLGSRCQVPKHWRFEFQMMEELLMVLHSRRNHMYWYWWMFFFSQDSS